MFDWLSRLALELIGQAGIGYSFDTLAEGEKCEYTAVVKDLMFALSSINFASPVLTQDPQAHARNPSYPPPHSPDDRQAFSPPDQYLAFGASPDEAHAHNEENCGSNGSNEPRGAAAKEEGDSRVGGERARREGA